MIVYDTDNRKIDIVESKEIARGGEGRIIEVTKKIVAKIYLDRIPPITEKKFIDLYALSRKEFINPQKLLFNKKKKVVGYLMNSVPSSHFPLYSAYNNAFFKRMALNSSWKKDISNILIDCVDFTHSKHIIIGDLSGFNILTSKKGQVSFIDVDSFETPSQKHSGRMLTDIRDFLLGGVASKESDYFSLAVILFNLFTAVHPFKGMHKVHRSLEDRQLLKIPVFDLDPHLVIPKCYTPITDKYLADQFKAIFKNGDRFLISLNAKTIVPVFTHTNKVTTQTDSLKITQMFFNNEDILYVKSSDTSCVVVQRDLITIFEVRHSSHFRVTHSIPIDRYKNVIHDVMPSNYNTFIFMDQNLYIVGKNNNLLEVDGVSIDSFMHTQQYENVYVIITSAMTYIFQLDKCIGTHIKYQTKQLFGPAFKNYQGLIQNTSGESIIRYNSNHILNTLQFPFPIKDIYQTGNVGMAQYVKNNTLHHCLFNIDGLKINISGTDYDRIKNIALIKDTFILLPEDGAISFLREKDFYPVTKFETDLVDDSTQLYITGAGIIAVNHNKIHLINKK